LRRLGKAILPAPGTTIGGAAVEVLINLDCFQKHSPSNIEIHSSSQSVNRPVLLKVSITILGFVSTGLSRTSAGPIGLRRPCFGLL